MKGWFVAVPFQVTDGEDNWTDLKVALIFIQDDVVENPQFGISEGTREFIEGYVHPHADSKVWGPCADWGSSPEALEDGGYYITAVNPAEADEEEEMQTTMLQVRDTAKAFKTLRDAENYRDSLKVYEWVVEQDVPHFTIEDDTITQVLRDCEKD